MDRAEKRAPAEEPQQDLPEAQQDLLEAQPVAAASAAVPAGTIIGDHYEIISFLGVGGSSQVFKARHTFLDRFVAIKMLREHIDKGSDDFKRIRNEALALKELKHPNILAVHALGEWRGRFYLVVDLVEGTTLAEELMVKGRLPVERCLTIAEQCLGALEHAHDKGIIHRDIKPGNIMLEKDGNGNDLVKVVDFGIAKMFEGSQPDRLSTRTGVIIGSPYYMSPEQCQGQPLDRRTDIYSFGCVLHEMLSGDIPFRGETAVSTLMMQINEPFPVLDRALKVPTAVQSAILSAVAKDPGERLQSATAFAEALHDTTRSAVPPTNPSPKRKFNHAKPTIAAALLALAGVAGYLALTTFNANSYDRMTKELSTGTTTVAAEVKRINALQDHRKGGEEFISLLDAAQTTSGGTTAPMALAMVSAADYLGTIPSGSQESGALRSKISEYAGAFKRQADEFRPSKEPAVILAARGAFQHITARMDIINGHTRDTKLGQNLCHTAAQLCNAGKPQEAMVLYDLAQTWATKVHEERQLLEIRCAKALAKNHRRLPGAKEDLIAIADSAPHGAEAKVKSMLALGHIYMTEGDYSQAKSTLREARDELQSTAVQDRQDLYNCVRMGSAAALMSGDRPLMVSLVKTLTTRLKADPREAAVLPNAYVVLSQAYCDGGDSNSALSVCDEAIALFRSRHARTSAARMCARKADILRYYKQWQQGMDTLQQYVPFIDDIEDRATMAEMLSILSCCHWGLGNKKESDQTLDRAIAACQTMSVPTNKQQQLLSMAKRCDESGRLTKAAQLYQMAFAANPVDGSMRSDILARWADNLARQNKPDLARQKLHLAQTEALREQNDPMTRAYWTYRLGEFAHSQCKYEEAATYLKKAVAEYRQTNRRDHHLCQSLAFLALNLELAGESAAGEQVLSEALQIAREAGPPRSAGSDIEKQVYLRLVQYYEQRRQYDRALEMYDNLLPFFNDSTGIQMQYHARRYAALLRSRGKEQAARTLEKRFGPAVELKAGILP